jgi:serine protease AprX
MVGQDTANSIGVAPRATWIACRNMERGNGQLSTYLECFEWFWAPTDSEGKNPDVTKSPHVINNSWYCSDSEGCNPDNWEPLQLAVRNLKASGIVVVVSAGNSGPNCGTVTGPPALFEPSFTIGATAINDTIASFSSRGPVAIDSSFRMKPDVSAPGRGVRSVIRGGAFANFSGTSMAGPHVVGLVALILSANKELEGEVETVESIIRQTADPKYTDQECGGVSGQALPNPIYGFGRVNALKAVEMALKTPSGSSNIPSTQNNWLVFPNPTSGILSIKNPGIETTQIYVVKLKDIDGRILRQQFFQNQTQLDLSFLPNNLYILEIIGDKKVFVSKVVKK